MKKAILLLADGRIFKGYVFGAEGETIGEVCFNTGMTGYQEILTDPSYCRQIIIMTAPHIGNYGINPEDIESNKIQAAGFVIKEESPITSNWRSKSSISDYLNNENSLTINLATGQSHSVLDIIEMTKKISGKEISYDFANRRDGDPDQLFSS